MHVMDLMCEERTSEEPGDTCGGDLVETLDADGDQGPMAVRLQTTSGSGWADADGAERALMMTLERAHVGAAIDVTTNPTCG